MSATYRIDLFIPRRKLYVQIEGYDSMYITLEPHTEIVDDLKQIVLYKDRFKYRAFYRKKYLDVGDPIPTGTSSEVSVMIKTHRPSYSYVSYCCISKLIICFSFLNDVFINGYSIK